MTVTYAGAANLLEGVVVGCCFTNLSVTSGETLVPGFPGTDDGGTICVATLPEGILKKSTRLSCWVAARCGDVGGFVGGGDAVGWWSTVASSGLAHSLESFRFFHPKAD